MHSGINTYIPRAVKSLDRRLAAHPEIKEELSMPLKMLRGGLEHTQRVYRGVRAFTDLVREGVPLEREDHDLQQILEDYLENTAYSDSVMIEPLVTASVNDALFCTAIDNFIRNGLKYNDSHSKMVVVKMVANNVIAIIDNGRGMSQEDFEKYAKPYVRKQGQSESGSGLGLNISLAILQEHGFTVSSEIQDAGGTKILVRLS
jgi:signal transduction histidine kinase